MPRLLDQHPVIEDNRGTGGHELLISEVRIAEGTDSHAVAVSQHAAQLGAGHGHAAGDDECRITQIDEGDIAPLVDSPPVTQLGWETGLPAA